MSLISFFTYHSLDSSLKIVVYSADLSTISKLRGTHKLDLWVGLSCQCFKLTVVRTVGVHFSSQFDSGRARHLRRSYCTDGF